MEESIRNKTQRKILRISMLATVILLASVFWVNYERNVRHGDKTLTFDQQPLTEVIAIVEETYAVNVDAQDFNISSCLVTVEFVDKTLEEVLSYLNSKYELKIERLEKRKFKIRASNC